MPTHVLGLTQQLKTHLNAFSTETRKNVLHGAMEFSMGCKRLKQKKSVKSASYE